MTRQNRDGGRPRDQQGRERKRDDINEHWHAGILSELDQRTALARALRDRLHALMDDLGGETALSYQQRVICERVIFLELWCQRAEARLCRDGTLDNVAVWTQASNTLAGLLAKLGLERQTRDVPDLQSYLRQRSRETSS
mgnify:CR=1 FL=1